MRYQELFEQRAKIHADLVAVLNGPRTSESRAKAEKMLADIELISADISRVNRASLVNSLADSRFANVDNAKAAQYRAAYVDYLRCGEPGQRAIVGNGAKPENLALLREARTALINAKPEQRDQQAGVQSITYTEGQQGGYFVPAGFAYDIEQATKYFADLLNICKVVKTATGAILPWPTGDDTDNAWHILGEAQQIVDEGITPNYSTQGTPPTTDAGNAVVQHLNLQAWKGSTGLIRVSLELLQDSAFDLQEYLTERFGERLGRGYEAYFTNGSGLSQPTGILPAIASSGAVAVTAQGSSANDGVSGNTGANSIGYVDLVSLIHSVDPTYRKRGSFMLHDNTLAHLKTRLDKYGRPLWVPAMQYGEPDTLCGYPYVVNQSFPQIAASKTTVAFGDWSKFIIRQVKDLSILRLDERFADYGEVGFIGFSRVDSNLIDAGQHPINVLQQHS